MKFPPPERPRPAAVPESLPLFWEGIGRGCSSALPGRTGLKQTPISMRPGGDSIKAIQLSSRLKEQGLELSVRDILVHPVLSEMAGYIVPAVPRRNRGCVRERSLSHQSGNGFLPINPPARPL